MTQLIDFGNGKFFNVSVIKEVTLESNGDVTVSVEGCYNSMYRAPDPNGSILRQLKSHCKDRYVGDVCDEVLYVPKDGQSYLTSVSDLLQNKDEQIARMVVEMEETKTQLREAKHEAAVTQALRNKLQEKDKEITELIGEIKKSQRESTVRLNTIDNQRKTIEKLQKEVIDAEIIKTEVIERYNKTVDENIKLHKEVIEAKDWEDSGGLDRIAVLRAEETNTGANDRRTHTQWAADEIAWLRHQCTMSPKTDSPVGTLLSDLPTTELLKRATECGRINSPREAIELLAAAINRLRKDIREQGRFDV